jgi:hypothetical protein
MTCFPLLIGPKAAAGAISRAKIEGRPPPSPLLAVRLTSGVGRGKADVPVGSRQTTEGKLANGTRSNRLSRARRARYPGKRGVGALGSFPRALAEIPADIAIQAFPRLLASGFKGTLRGYDTRQQPGYRIVNERYGPRSGTAETRMGGAVGVKRDEICSVSSPTEWPGQVAARQRPRLVGAVPACHECGDN